MSEKTLDELKSQNYQLLQDYFTITQENMRLRDIRHPTLPEMELEIEGLKQEAMEKDALITELQNKLNLFNDRE